MSEGGVVPNADIPSQAAQSGSAQPPIRFGAGLPSPPPTQMITSPQAAVTPASQNQNILGSCYFYIFSFFLALSIRREANSGTGDVPEPLGHSLTAICKGSNQISPQPQ